MTSETISVFFTGAALWLSAVRVHLLPGLGSALESKQGRGTPRRRKNVHVRWPCLRSAPLLLGDSGQSSKGGGLVAQRVHGTDQNQKGF
jgi:hypothetical protein